MMDMLFSWLLESFLRKAILRGTRFALLYESVEVCRYKAECSSLQEEYIHLNSSSV